MARFDTPGKKKAEALILGLASGLSVPAAARQAGLSERTAWRRLRDKRFRRRVAEARTAALERAVSRLTAACDKAVLVLVGAFKGKDRAVAVRAAKTLLDQAFKGAELMDLHHEVEELRERFDVLEKGRKK